MLVVEQLGLSGVADFKPTKLNIARGITYLYGKNMLMDGIGNAAGKSVFASATADIFYDTPIIGEKEDKAKSGVRMIQFMKGKRRVKIQTTYNGRSERVKIAVDGEEKKGATPSKTKSLIPRYWAITEDEYRTYGFMDSKMPHKLVMGDSTERKKFFTSFFQLDRLDAEKKVLAARASELRKIKTQFTELEATFNAVKSDMLKKGERQELESKLGQLETRLKKLRSRSDESQRVKSLLQFESYAADQIKAGRKLCPDLADLPDRILELKAELKRARKAQSQLEEWKVYKRQLATWTEAAEGLDTERDLDELEKASRAFTKATAELKLYEKVVSPELLYGPALRQMKQSAEKPQVSKAEMAKREVKLDQMVAHSKKFKGGICGECGQPVAKHDPDKIDTLKTELEELEMAWQQWDRYADLKAKYESEMETYGPKAEARDKAERVQNKNRDDHALYMKLQRLGPKPEKVEKPEVSADIEQLSADLKVLEFWDQNLVTIKALSELTDEQRTQVFDSSALEDVQDRLSSTKTKLEVHNTVKARATDMRNRLAELKEQLSEEEALQFALAAYDDKAVKRMAIEAISEQMMGTINKMGTLVFDNYRFEFMWDTKIRLLVHRRGKSPTDVRKLSGAESTLFTMILIFSLLMYVPSDKRLSLLVMDEPCASFHEGMIDRFHTLLPHLLTVIPSILIVTPKEYERYPGAKEYTIYRDASGASIRKGHPSDIK